MKSAMMQRQAQLRPATNRPCSTSNTVRAVNRGIWKQPSGMQLLCSAQTDTSAPASSSAPPPSAEATPQVPDGFSRTINSLDTLIGAPPPPPPKPAAVQTPAPPRVTPAAARNPAAQSQSQRDVSGRPDRADESFTGIMGFSGLAPEVINARCAMIGFLVAISSELGNGQSIYVQLVGGGALRALLVIAFVMVASFAPKLNKDTTWTSVFAKNRQPAVFGPFDANAELINGRAAMLGLATILFIEGTSSYAFFS